MLRMLSVACAVILLAMAALAVALSMMLSLTWWTQLSAFGLLMATTALVTRRRGPWLLGAGLLLLIGSPAVRLSLTRNSTEQRLITLPDGLTTRFVDALFPERDGCLLAARLLRITGGLQDPEAPRFEAILRESYGRIANDSLLPTPAIATYLGMQSPHGFDAVIIAPRTPPKGALIFLHGYAGNFFVYCWEIAQAAAAADLLTICPSVSERGAWWNADGERTFTATLRYVRSRGLDHVYLAGLSNGAVGAATIASRHARELKGLVLISGTQRTVRASKLPALVVQGASDQMMPASSARAYAKGPSNTRYRELPGGHFIFLSAHMRVRALITDFLRELERR